MKKLSLLVLLVTAFFSHHLINSESAMAASVYDFKVKDIDGKEVSLADYKGKALMIVNTASRCGFTPQYQSLQTLYDTYREKGFVVLGFPANNFMGQEPGSDKEIKEFCSTKFRVKFPMFSKISVRGKDIDPLYKYLTTDSGFEESVKWNFTKYIVDRNGNVIARHGSSTDPLAGKVIVDVEKALASTAQ